MPRILLAILIIISFSLGFYIDSIVESMFPYTEIGMVCAIFFSQLHFTLLAANHSKQLREMYPEKPNQMVEVADNGLIIPLNDRNKEFSGLINITNEYLINNKGAVDFNIIREISERKISSIDKSINATVSVPLYIGLLGTMFGIIYGLFGIEYPISDNALSILLDGVKIAMIGSFSGLFLTIIGNSWVYKSAKLANDKNKDSFYTFIQTNVLGTNNSSLASSLNSLNYRLKVFGKSFDQSITNLSDSTRLIEEVSKNQVSTIEQQKNTITEIKELGLNQLTELNVKIFDHLQENMENIDSLNINLQPISDLIRQNNESIQRINQLYLNIANSNGRLETVFNNLYQTTTDTKELGTFLKQHYSGINSLSEGTKELVSEQKKVLSGENEMFKLFLDEKQKKYTGVLDNYLNEFSSQLSQIGDKSKEAVTEQVKGLNDLTEAFSMVLKKNNQFLSDKITEMQTEWEKTLKKISEENKINKIEEEVISIKTNFEEQNTILVKLVENISTKSNVLDDVSQKSLQIMAEYYEKRMTQKSIWIRLSQSLKKIFSAKS